MLQQSVVRTHDTRGTLHKMAWITLGVVTATACASAVYLSVILKLSPTEWQGLRSAAGYALIGTLAVMAGAGWLVLGGLGESIAAGAQGDEEAAASAYRRLARLPLRIAALIGGGFGLFGLTTILSFAASHASLWNATLLVLLHGALSAGLLAGTFWFFVGKRELRPLVEFAAEHVPDMQQRRELAANRPIRRKVLVSVLGVTLVLVQLAMIVARADSDRRTETLATDLQKRFLSLHRLDLIEGDREEVDQIAAVARSHGIASSLVILDRYAENTLHGEADRLTERERDLIRATPHAGNGLGLDSDNCMAWISGSDRVVVLLRPWSAVVAGSDDGGYFFLVLIISSLLAGGLALLLSHDLGFATETLRRQVEQVAEGDLRPIRIVESDDEIGTLSRALDVMVRSTRETVEDLALAVENVEGATRGVAAVAQTVSNSAASQKAGVDGAAAFVDRIGSGMTEIAGSAENLHVLVDASNTSVIEMSAATDQLTQTASSLTERIDGVSSSIDHMLGNVGAVAQHTETLSGAAEHTSESMQEMAIAMKQVSDTANVTAELSNRVVETAERGHQKVVETIDGMESIRTATDAAEAVIRNLGRNAEKIGAILDVIDDVAAETNLLALNAAIIAARAGEQGRSFSIVAEQIKKLADRVLDHTSEIASVIRSLQEESSNAVGAIETGSKNVASGVELSAEAGNALDEIRSASHESGVRILEIVNAVHREADSAGHVVDLMERVNMGIAAIRAATQAQHDGSATIGETSAAMRNAAAQLHQTTTEQARGGRHMSESTEGIRVAVKEINQSLSEQAQASDELIDFIESVASGVRENEGASERLTAVTLDMQRQSQALREQLSRLRLR